MSSFRSMSPENIDKYNGFISTFINNQNLTSVVLFESGIESLRTKSHTMSFSSVNLTRYWKQKYEQDVN